MIEVHDAVQFAVEAAKSFFEDVELEDLALEEVELSDDEQFWLITLGFYVQNRNPTRNKFTIAIDGERKYIRKYKVFKIDAEAGKVISMKIRETRQE